jgi:hypothetical protein
MATSLSTSNLEIQYQNIDRNEYRNAMEVPGVDWYILDCPNDEYALGFLSAGFALNSFNNGIAGIKVTKDGERKRVKRLLHNRFADSRSGDPIYPRHCSISLGDRSHTFRYKTGDFVQGIQRYCTMMRLEPDNVIKIL